MKRLGLREQRLIWVTTIVLGAWGGWTLMISPLLTARATALDDIASANAIADLLALAPVTDTGPQGTPTAPLRTRVTARAEAAGLAVRRLEPSGTALSVTLEDASYTALIGWLDVLTRAERARIVSLEIARRPVPGMVSAQVLLEARP